MQDLLTEEEKAELEAHPMGTIKSDIGGTPQFELRLCIAKKKCQWYLDNDPTLSAEARAMYEKYPMWQFYCNLDMTRPRRMYGVFDVEKNLLYMIGAAYANVYNCLDGFPANDVTTVDRWSHGQIVVINTSPKHAHLFFDPLGFIGVVKAFSQ